MSIQALDKLTVKLTQRVELGSQENIMRTDPAYTGTAEQVLAVSLELAWWMNA